MNKKILSAVSAVSIMLSFASCQKDISADNKALETKISSGTAAADNKLMITEYFEEECLTGLNCISDVRDIKCANGKLYITGGKKTDGADREWFRQVYDISSGKSDEMSAERYGKYGEAQISSGYVTVEAKFDETGDEAIKLCVYDKNSGELINSTNVGTYSSKIFTDKNDRIYLCGYREVEVYDKELKLIKKIDSALFNSHPEMQSVYFYDFELASDGSLYIAGSEKSPETTYVAKINTSFDIEYVTGPFIDAGQYITGLFESADGNITLCTDRYFSYINKISAQTGETLLRYEVENAEKFFGEYNGYVICEGNGKIFGYNFMDDEYIDISKYDSSSYRLSDVIIKDGKASAYFQEYEKELGGYLYIADKNGNIENYIKTGSEKMCITSDGTVYYLSSEHGVETSDGCVYETTEYAVYRYNGKDEPELLISIPKENTDYSFSGFAVDESGNIYTSKNDWENGNEINIYSENGELSKKISSDEMIYGLFEISGKIYAYNYDTLFLLDSENEKLEKISQTHLPSQERTSKGDDRFDLYYSTESGISGYSISDGKDTEIISFINADISADISEISCSAADGSENFYYAAYSGEGMNIYHLKKADEEKLNELNRRKIITLAGKELSSGGIYKKIKEFNKTSSEFYIYANDYSKYDKYSKDSYFSGCEQLSADIVNGFAPDIIISDGYADYQSLISMNAFADINEFLEKDTELKRSDFLENILDTGTQNGILYRISPMYMTITTVAGKDNTDDKPMTYAEFFGENDVPPLYAATRENIYPPLISSYINDFVNFENSSCDFDNDTFAELIDYLKNCKTMDEFFEDAENDDYKDVSNEDILSENLARMCEIWDVTELISDETVIKGYPSRSGTLQTVYFPYSFSIMSSSENKEAAWQFIRSFFTEEYQEQFLSEEYSAVPIRRDILERFAEAKIMLRCGTASDEELKHKLINYINSPAVPLIYRSRIMDIISEELDKFYENVTSAEDTAKTVQNKVKLYLAEIG